MQARKEEPNLQTVSPSSDGETAVTPEPAKPKKNRTGLFVVLGVLAVAAVIFLGRYLSYSRTHVTTDNAFLAADITYVSPQVSALVTSIKVADNQQVKAGQLLLELDDSTYKVNVEQAEANLSAALASERAAQADLALSEKTSQGQLTQATGGVQQAQGGVKQARATLSNAEAAVTAAREDLSSYQAQAQASKIAIQSAEQNRTRALQAVKTAAAQVSGAQSAITSAKANLKAAQAHATFAKNQVARFQSLAAQGAASREQAESAQQDFDTAEAAVQSATAQVATAEATLLERQGDLATAQQGVPIATSAIAQARASANAADHQSQILAAMVNEAIANRANMAEGISTAQGKVTQAAGQQQAANTVSQVLATKQAAAQAAAAKVAQAKAALAQAKLDLQHTKIYAPVDGHVGNRGVDQGSMVQPGLPVMAVVKDSSLYVAVNLKETQTANLVAGEEAEIEVDGYPVHPFKGRIQSVSPATGATFALLPPDNASGNFVKVVQRVPVRVTFDPDQPDLDKLRPGMSANVSIRVK